MNFKNIIKFSSNIPGWRTSRKIVVIESDDWGSIRMPSLSVYKALKDGGLNVYSGDNERFNTLDTLASAKDFEALFETLTKHVDSQGNHPVFTAMSLCANPDFERIKEVDFLEYFYEPITETLIKYGLANAFSFWQEGEKQGLFYPEFHGREHLNIAVWMKDLQAGNIHTMKAFEKGFWGFRNSNPSGVSYQAAFDLDVRESLVIQKEVVSFGLDLFEKLHKRRATFFVPPNGAIHQDIIDHSVSQGIRYVSSPKVHSEPQGEGKVRKRFRFIGKRGANSLMYLTRNCFFEPSYKGRGFSVDDCLRQIDSAFMFRKPAVISTHRVNFVGGLVPDNRASGNMALNALFSRMLTKWPNIEFMTSSQLGDLIRND